MNRNEEAPEKENVESRQSIAELWLAGLIATDLLILQAFLSLGALDLAALIAMITFAVSLPYLVFYVLWRQAALKTREKKVLESKFYASHRDIDVLMLAIPMNIIGIIAAFWHVSLWVGVVMTISSLSCIIMYVVYVVFE